MPRYRPWIAALILPLAAAAPGRAQTPPAGPVKLELKLKAGQAQTYRLTVDTDLSANLPGGAVKKTSTRSMGTFEMTVDRVNGDGGYSVRVKPLSQSVSVDGKDKTPDNLPDAEVRATLLPDGRFTNLSGAQKAEGASTGVMDAEDFMNTVFDKSVGFPARTLAVGEGWTDQIDSPLDESQPKVDLHSKLVALDMLNGRPVARVLHVVVAPIVDAKKQEGVTMGGSIEGGGLGTVDLGTGLVLDEQDVLRLKVDVTAQNPSNASQIVNLGTIANIRVHVLALPDSAS